MHDTFINWIKKEVEPIPGVEIMVYGDTSIADFPFHPVEVGGNKWADDVIWATHEAALETARKYNFDAVVFQGLDLITLMPGDYERFITNYAGSEEYDIIAPVQMGRKEPHYPVARRWKEIEVDDEDFWDSEEVYISSKQNDVRVIELKANKMFPAGGPVPVGFPGTEMCLVNKQCFHIPIAHPDYRMWYLTNDERDYLCVHEHWMLMAAREGFQAWVDTSIDTAHCDDSGMAAITLSDPIPNEEVFKIWR